jgi:hypothetical protein
MLQERAKGALRDAFDRRMSFGVRSALPQMHQQAVMLSPPVPLAT